VIAQKPGALDDGDGDAFATVAGRQLPRRGPSGLVIVGESLLGELVIERELVGDLCCRRRGQEEDRKAENA